ncbi:MAG: LLM class flavin-dependent oxidoreductase, partial [Chitinophagaceae bacterium]|nr:LLM class flavin-dependent oxidoreductase [Chitinophagaceae bacterium]
LLPPPVKSMEGIWTIYEEEAVKQMLRYSFIGGPATIRKELGAFIAKYQVNEVMATSHIFDHSAKLKSYEIFARTITDLSLPSADLNR